MIFERSIIGSHLFASDFFDAHQGFLGLALRLPEYAAKEWSQMLGPLAGSGQLTFALVGHLLGRLRNDTSGGHKWAKPLVVVRLIGRHFLSLTNGPKKPIMRSIRVPSDEMNAMSRPSGKAVPSA